MNPIEKILDIMIPNYKIKMSYKDKNDQYIYIEYKGYFLTTRSLMKKSGGFADIGK